MKKLIELFDTAPFLQSLGIQLVSFHQGYCETRLPIEPRHLQQNGFVHAGVIATMADHTAGGAGTTWLNDDRYVLTVEFKVNFLRPATAKLLTCQAKTLKAGKSITVVESEVHGEQSAATKSTLIAKATITLAVVGG